LIFFQVIFPSWKYVARCYKLFSMISEHFYMKVH
jgi:hypothetical protein